MSQVKAKVDNGSNARRHAFVSFENIKSGLQPGLHDNRHFTATMCFLSDVGRGGFPVLTRQGFKVQ